MSVKHGTNRFYPRGQPQSGAPGALCWTEYGGNVCGLTTLTNNVAIGGTVMSGNGERLRVLGDSRVEGCTQVKTHSAFTRSEYVVCTDAVQTDDAAPTTAATVTLADNSSYWIKAKVTARSTTVAADKAAFEIMARVEREGGGGAALGGAGVQNTFTDRFPSGGGAPVPWDATFTVSGNDVLVTVTGEGGNIINWSVTVSRQAVSEAA